MNRLKLKKHVAMIIVTIIITALTIQTTYAGIYVLGYSSVSGGAIGYCNSSTNYTSNINWAVALWNTKNKVNIYNSGCTWTDLEWKDVYEYPTFWAGRYINNAFTRDYIHINNAYVFYYSATVKNNVCAHELGHSLGLEHSLPGNIMYSAATETNTFGSSDNDSYNWLYP